MNIRIIIIKSAVVLGTVLSGLSLESCRKEARPGDYVPKTGDEVVFSAADGGSAIGTKAAYAGETINWEQGDLFRIYCADCSEPTTTSYGNADHWADYKAQGRNESNTGVTISTLTGTVGLRWGDVSTVHNFYGIYPSPKMNTDEAKTTLNGAVLTGTIRQNQEVKGVASTELEKGKTLTTVLPDMTDMYMAGKTSVNPSTGLTDNNVLIRYTPLTTAIEFTITKDTDQAEDVQWVAIESASHKLHGVFTANLAEEWSKPDSTYTKTYPKCTYEDSKTEGGKRLTIYFTDMGMKISKTEALRFTFLLLPVSGAANVVDDLTFLISKRKSGTGSYSVLKTELKRTDKATEEANKVPFPTHKKSYIRGLMVPDRVQWTITFEPTVNPWGENDGGEAYGEEIYNLTFATALEEWKEDTDTPDINL